MSDRGSIPIIIDSNKKTCGNCRFLQKSDYEGFHQDEWWCQFFNQSRGLVGAMKTPNRSNLCLKAEKGSL